MSDHKTAEKRGAIAHVENVEYRSGDPVWRILGGLIAPPGTSMLSALIGKKQ